MTPEVEAQLTESVREAVRQASQELRLVTRDDILAALQAEGQRAEGEPPVPDEELGVLLDTTLAGAPGLAALHSLTGQTLYHDPALLSQTYARILDRRSSHVVLLSEEIRANSRDYPRPVPVELFEAAPFDLTPEEIELAMQALAASPDHQDITFTTTPAGVVYLFSTLHLERGYADFLAQRAESLVMNP
jgi:hypothetical protein